MFATGPRTSPAAKVDQTWTASTDRAVASNTPRGTNTPSIILSPDRESEHRGKAGRPARTETAAPFRAGGDSRVLSPTRARLPRRHECAPVLAGVKVVRPAGRSTLTPAPGRQQDNHEGTGLSSPHQPTPQPPTTGKDLTATLTCAISDVNRPPGDQDVSYERSTPMTAFTRPQTPGSLSRR
jgi:hypothetical protein